MGFVHANNENRETTHDERNRATGPRKGQNIQRKGNLNYMGILEADTIKQVERKKKNQK